MSISLSDYYKLMGWDLETGKPTLPTLKRLGLKDVAEGMVRRNLRGEAFNSEFPG